MKKLTLILCALFFCNAGYLLAQGRSGGGERGGGESSGFSSNDNFRSSSASPRLQSMGVRSVPRTYSNRSQLFSSNHYNLGMPSRGPRGTSFRASTVSPRAMSSVSVRNNMRTVNNVGFRSRINGYNVRENTVGRYYWHNYNGLNFCHYYDRWGCNWYGWYAGPGFYWSCWWGNNWWWYDPAAYRWCYWYDGWWWWQNPDDVNATYVYNNGDYVPADSQESASDESQAPVNPVNNAAPAAPLTTKTFKSKDGTRMVKLVGTARDAFLYDTSSTPAFKPKYLASNVKDVRFSSKNNGQVTLGLNDGSSEVYDLDGNSTDSN